MERSLCPDQFGPFWGGLYMHLPPPKLEGEIGCKFGANKISDSLKLLRKEG